MHRRDDDQDPLDLPLGPEREPEPDVAPDERGWSGGPSGWSDDVPGPAPPAGPAGRRRWPLLLLAALALLVLLALAGIVGYLLPRPGPPVLRLSAPMVDFATVSMGTTAPAHELTLESTGERPVELGELTLTGAAPEAFEIAADGCSGTSLAPGRTCTVVLRFTPRRAAAVRATLEVPAEASNGPLSVPLSGEGVAPEPVLDRRRVEFAPAPVGSPSRPEVVTLSNRGGAPLEVAGMALVGAAADDFGLAGDRCTGESLDPAEECTVRVELTPGTEGERRATLRFRLRGAAPDAPPVEVALGGIGVAAPAAERPGAAAPRGSGGERAQDPGQTGATAPAPVTPPPPPPPPPPELAAEPSALDFGEVPLGGEEAGEVVVRNSGGSPARLGRPLVTGGDAASFTLRDDRCGGGELAAGERCTLRVVLRPRQEGVLQARLEISSPDLAAGGEALEVTLRGAGAVGRLTPGARELAFGEVRQGASSERRLTLSNTGRAAVEVGEVTIRGGGAPEFALVGEGCPETVPLAPGGRCELTLRFAPAAEGRREAVLVVGQGGANRVLEVTLGGTGLPAPAPRAQVAPGNVGFGAVGVGGRSEIETVTVTNRGTARMAVGEARIEGPDAADFHVVPGSCAGASFLVPGSDCTVGVRFSPSASGAHRATLVIPHDAQGRRSVVELTGTGSP